MHMKINTLKRLYTLYNHNVFLKDFHQSYLNLAYELYQLIYLCTLFLQEGLEFF